MVSSIWATIQENQDTQDSVVDFPTKTRFHIAVNVKSVKNVEGFYSRLFGKEPHTAREGYIKYDLDEPPLNISLNEVPKNASGEGIYGIQSRSRSELDAIRSRLAELDYKVVVEKRGGGEPDVIAVDPEGNQWHIALFEMQ
jgi:hypothetical protein